MIGGDTLTCGVCQKDFALADIVKFIQHKVLTCNKENHPCKNKDTSEAAAATTENGGANAAESDGGESNNNSTADADKAGMENGEKKKDVDVNDEDIDGSDKREGDGPEAPGGACSSSTSDKENSASAADCEEGEGEGAEAGEAKTDLESSAKSPPSPVTSTPDSSARKRKAACVDADTNTVITGKAAGPAGARDGQDEARRELRARPAAAFPNSAICNLWFSGRSGAGGSDFHHSARAQPVSSYPIYSSSSDDDSHLR